MVWEEELRSATSTVATRALYCIEGVHDAQRTPSPLYIGRAGAGELGSRLSAVGSLGHFLYTDKEQSALTTYSDVWNVVVRWAAFDGSDEELAAVERLLIRFHKPAYNANEVKGIVDGDLVVLNVGAKGTLIPVLASWYFAPMAWWPK